MSNYFIELELIDELSDATIKKCKKLNVQYELLSDSNINKNYEYKFSGHKKAVDEIASYLGY